MLETLLAGVNMEEMLYEIKDHCCAMNAGRWDYIFSAIKRLSRRADCVLPDRKMVSRVHVGSNVGTCFNPLIPTIKIQILLPCHHTLIIAAV